MPSPTKKTAKAAQNIKQAKELKQKGSIDEAIQEYNKVLKQAPKNFKALNQLVVLYTMQKKWQEVINYCYQIIALRPKYVPGYLRLAKALIKQDNLYGAVAAYQKAIELDANAVKAADYKQYGDILTKLGTGKAQKIQVNEAVAAYQKTVELKPKTPASVYLKLANTLEKQKRFAEAIASYNKLLEVKPELGKRIYVNLGTAQMKQGLLDEAIASFEKALETNPNLASAYGNLVTAYRKKGFLADALNNYEKALELKPNTSSLHRIMGDILTEQGRTKEAAQHYEQAKSTK